jgi:ABC-type nitrate/sulfonate/bicarbonate transport system permease component
MARVQSRLNRWSLAGLLTPLILWEAWARFIQRIYPAGAVLFPTFAQILFDALPGFATFDIGAARGFGGASSYRAAFAVLATQSLVTLLRVLVGIAAGLAIGIALGVALGWSRMFHAFLFPVIQFLRTIPYLALIVLFMLWFGGSAGGPIVYVAFTIAMVITLVTIEAIRNVPPLYRQYARTLGATEFQVFRTVVLPAILPSLVGAVRVVLGSAWAVILAAEYLSVQSGLGRLLILSEMFFQTGRMIVVVLLFMCYSAALNAAFLTLARRLTRWQPEAAV